MTTSFVDRIKAEISSSPSASFIQSVQLHLDYLEPKLVGFNKLARKLYQSINQPQQFCDFLTEGHWAMVLLHLGGTAEYEPLGESGPDLRFIYSSQKVDFHCKRLRNNPITANKLANYNGKLVEYGNVVDDTNTVFDRITSEQPLNIDATVPQLVAYWSDSDRIEEHEFRYALEAIQTTASNGQYSWISGVIYKVRIFQRFEHWYNLLATMPVSNELRIALNRLQPWPAVANCT